MLKNDEDNLKTKDVSVPRSVGLALLEFGTSLFLGISSAQKAILRNDVTDITNLKVGMVLDGTVRNIIDFGAFVDN